MIADWLRDIVLGPEPTAFKPEGLTMKAIAAELESSSVETVTETYDPVTGVTAVVETAADGRVLRRFERPDVVQREAKAYDPTRVVCLCPRRDCPLHPERTPLGKPKIRVAGVLSGRAPAVLGGEEAV